MADDSQIFRKRSSGGAANIGTGGDGAILEMINMGDRLIVVKEKALYEFYLADKVDPSRTNLDLPENIQSLLIDRGADSELVGRTFLVAKTLFRKEFFNEEVDVTRALLLSLDSLMEFVALDQEISNYLAIEKNAADKYEELRKQGGSFAIPSIPGVETKCKTIFQKADHIMQILMDITMIFFPDLKKKAFHELPEFLKVRYGDKDGFYLFVEKALFFVNILRELRNSLDHRLPHHKVKNFELQPAGHIISPTIEIDFKRAKLDRQALSHLLPIILQNLLSISEAMIAHISSKSHNGNFLAGQVKEIPENLRRYKHVRYSFWSNIGDGGYYNQ